MEIDFKNSKYSEEFLRDYVNNNKLDSYDWIYISRYQVLSEGFVLKFKNEINWNYISRCQILSEECIREFKDEVNWIYICKHQILSINFIDEMIQTDFIKENYINYLLENEKINQEELRSYLSI